MLPNMFETKSGCDLPGWMVGISPPLVYIFLPLLSYFYPRWGQKCINLLVSYAASPIDHERYLKQK